MKLLDFGSLNIDHVYRLERMVREGETIAAGEYQRNAGGKGLNQAIALRKAGAEVFMAGAVGQEGGFLLQFLAEQGVDTRHVRTLDAPTGHALIQVDGEGRNCIIVYGGANRLITPEMADSILDSFAPGDYVLLQNEISPLGHILRSAHERGLRIIINPSPITQELLHAPLHLTDWLILNETEGHELSGQTQADAILDALIKRYPGCRFVLTLGEAGSIYADSARRVKQPAFTVPAVDTTAAGDTFTGYFLESVMKGETVERALLRASKASSITVSRPGAGQSIPCSDEVELALQAIADR